MRLLGVVVVLMKQSWTCLSCQKLKNRQKSEKPQRPENLQRSSVWRNVYQSTDPPSIGYKEFELPLELWQFFELFCWAQKLSQYHVWIDYQLGSPRQSASLELLLRVLLHQVIVCKTHVIPLLNSGDALRKEISKPRIRAEILDGLERCRGS